MIAHFRLPRSRAAAADQSTLLTTTQGIRMKELRLLALGLVLAAAPNTSPFGADRTVIETSFAVVDDLHEHLGQLIAYSRMIGVTPPWSK